MKDAHLDTASGARAVNARSTSLGRGVNSYKALLRALATGRKQDFEAIPIGLGAKLTNPQSGLAFDLEGPDSHSISLRPAPALSSPEAAGELVELYWMALARDIQRRWH
jgi:hypothetical protein